MSSSRARRRSSCVGGRLGQWQAQTEQTHVAAARVEELESTCITASHSRCRSPALDVRCESRACAPAPALASAHPSFTLCHRTTHLALHSPGVFMPKHLFRTLSIPGWAGIVVAAQESPSPALTRQRYICPCGPSISAAPASSTCSFVKYTGPAGSPLPCVDSCLPPPSVRNHLDSHRWLCHLHNRLTRPSRSRPSVTNSAT